MHLLKLQAKTLWQRTAPEISDTKSAHNNCNQFSSQVYKPLFGEIIGHHNIKKILIRSLLSNEPVHVLLVGSPGSAKTLFLTEIIHSFRYCIFAVASNTTRAGLMDQLFKTMPKYLLMDELEKMNVADQTSLLHLMQTGIISETKMKKTRELKLTTRVIATANSCEKLITPLLSRFVILDVPEYTFEEFKEISVEILAKENVNKQLAATIAEKVWNELDSKDIRDVIKVSRLSDNNEEVAFAVSMMKRHHKRSYLFGISIEVSFRKGSRIVCLMCYLNT
jgi:MoxR-like ATPase